MKRDLDLMRNIMFQLEEPKFLCDNISAFFPNKTIDEYEIIAAHIELLADNNYLKLGSCLLGYGFPNLYIERITNDGYTFIESIRSDTTWSKLKPKLLLVGSYGLDVIKPLLLNIIIGKN